MGKTLATLIQSIKDLCPPMRVLVVDDASEDPETREVLARHKDFFVDVIESRESKAGKRHGNLYLNIQKSFSYADENGFDFLFMMQDDMQFVRPLSEAVLQEYSDLFSSDPNVIQVDPRFLRRGGNYEVLADRRAYRYDRTTSYADVGITHVGRLKALGWRFLEGERVNRDALSALGCQRLFPFTPIMTHVPFPKTYRRGREKFSLLPLRRGTYSYRYMTETETKAMDARPVSDYPHFRTYLHPRNMLLSRIFYEMRKDTKVFN